jgi:hypothetical protein
MHVECKERCRVVTAKKRASWKRNPDMLDLVVARSVTAGSGIANAVPHLV